MIYKGRVLFKSWLLYQKLFSGLVAVYSGWRDIYRDGFCSSLGYCYKKLFSGSVAVSSGWHDYKGRVLFKSWLSYQKLFSGSVAVSSDWCDL